MWTVARSVTATVNVELGCKVKLDVAPGCGGYRDRVRISELAARVGVPISTVRYYERIGLLGTPTRTLSGYRDYGEDEATRLLFVFRARKVGLRALFNRRSAMLWPWLPATKTLVRNQTSNATASELPRSGAIADKSSAAARPALLAVANAASRNLGRGCRCAATVRTWPYICWQ